MLEALAKWSRERLFLTLALAYVATLEGMSWLTSRGPLCIVETAQNGCPTLHSYFISQMARILEAIGHEWIIAISAAVTAVFTGTLWYSTKRLWKSGEIHSERQLRAYVFVSNAEIANLVATGIPEARITIKNSGQTPAYGVIHLSRIVIDCYPSPSIDLSISDQEFSNPWTRMSLGPGDSVVVPVGAGRAVTPAEIASLNNRTTVIYVSGEIRYRDAFGKDRWTKYRMWTGGAAGTRGNQLAGCFEGNEAD